MPLIIINVLRLTGVAAAYFLLFALIPFWLRGYKLSDENVHDKLACSFLTGHVVIILAVYLLALLGIFSRITIILLLILVAAAYLMLFRRDGIIMSIKKAYIQIENLSDGSYSYKVFLRNMLHTVKTSMAGVARKINNPVALLFTLGIFGYGAYIRCYHSVTNMFFGTSDMYLHVEWTKFFMDNKPFMAGVYPFGLHAVISAISSVFGINVITVMQMFGPVSGMLTIFAIYYFILRKFMKSTFGINLALALFVVTDIFPFWASERQFLALPQEFGTVFLYFAPYFFYIYMKEKKTCDLVSFAAAISLTMTIHFFVTICAALLCICIFIFSIARLKWKTFVRLAVGVFCALLIAVLPMAAGLLKGIPFNSSMDWALSFILGSAEPETETAGGGTEAIQGITLSDVISDPAKLYELSETAIGTFYSLGLLDPYWFMPYLIALAAAFIMPLFKFKSRGERQWIFPGLASYSLLLYLLFLLSFYGIFSLMESSRLYSFFIYSVPLVITVPIELLHALLYRKLKLLKLGYITIIAALGAAVTNFVWTNQRFMPLGRVWQSQYSGAVIAYYDILEKYPGGDWIVISAMSEYVLCLNEGFHYQLADFIVNMSDYDSSTEVFMDSHNAVFFFAVKRPNTYNDGALQTLGAFEPLPEYDPDDAYVDLADFGAEKGAVMTFIYQNFEANRVLQAKAHAWAREYQKYFPDEMSVFYEDDEIIVYEIVQNPYAVYNFAIPYIGNT